MGKCFSLLERTLDNFFIGLSSEDNCCVRATLISFTRSLPLISSPVFSSTMKVSSVKLLDEVIILASTTFRPRLSSVRVVRENRFLRFSFGFFLLFSLSGGIMGR